MKNVGDLEAIYSMCLQDADVYGFIGESSYRPGLDKFFGGHPKLLHRLQGEPEVVGPSTVQYVFEKSWRDKTSGELQRWHSVDADAAKPRDKVERLDFSRQKDGELKLRRVAVVDRAAAVMSA